jgi:hypothetical protein
MNEQKDYKFEVGKLADFLLSNGFNEPKKNEDTVDYAIRVIQENTLDKIYTIFGKRFKHTND